MALMRRLIGWMAGLAGIAALAKVLHKRPQPALPSGSQPSDGDDPAEELRRKLAEARATAATTPVASPVTEPADADETAPTGPSLEERRADVHARAQEAIDAMREPTE